MCLMEETPIAARGKEVFTGLIQQNEWLPIFFMKATIINSIEEPMVDATLRIVDDLRKQGIDANAMHIEEMIFKNFKNLNKDAGDLIYLLTNDDNVGITVRMLNGNGKNIINYNFLEKKYSKIDVQFLLAKNSIGIPDNYFSPKLPNLSKIQKELPFPQDICLCQSGSIF